MCRGRERKRVGGCGLGHVGNIKIEKKREKREKKIKREKESEKMKE